MFSFFVARKPRATHKADEEIQANGENVPKSCKTWTRQVASTREKNNPEKSLIRKITLGGWQNIKASAEEEIEKDVSLIDSNRLRVLTFLCFNFSMSALCRSVWEVYKIKKDKFVVWASFLFVLIFFFFRWGY